MNPDKKAISHGQGGDAPASPVPGYESYGGGERDAVGGGPAGRGNDTGSTVDTTRDWGRGDNEKDEPAKPVKATPEEPGRSRGKRRSRDLAE